MSGLVQFFGALISSGTTKDVQFKVLQETWKQNSLQIIGQRGPTTPAVDSFILAVIVQGKDVDTDPVNGVDYDAGPYGTGDPIGDGFVGYKGTDPNFEITGLQRLTKYGYKIYEARIIDGQIVYNKS